MTMSAVVGVDAGATKVCAVALDREGRTAEREVVRCGNPLVAGVEAVAKIVAELAEEVLTKLGEEKAEALAICAAGAGAGEVREALRQALLERGVASQVLCYHDAFGAWAGAFELEPGVVVCAGTGAIAFGVDGQGNEYRADGWGPILGDEGSAYFVALEGLRASARALDGRGPQTSLLPRMLEHFGAKQFRDLVGLTKERPHAEIAQASRVVIEVAREGDLVAQSILAEAGRRLALSAKAVVEKFSDSEVKVALVGGLAEGAGELLSRPFRHALKTLVREKRLTFVAPLHPPAFGAALLAAREAWED